MRRGLGPYATAIGTVNATVVPCGVLSIPTDPPISATSFEAIVRPRPTPP